MHKLRNFSSGICWLVHLFWLHFLFGFQAHLCKRKQSYFTTVNVVSVYIAFQLFNEVKARREASENSTNNKSLDITLLPVSPEYSQRANGYHHGPSAHPNNIRPVHQCSDTAVGFQHPNDYCNGSKLNSLSNGALYPASCHDIERQDATLDILNGYLRQGPQFGNILRNPGVSNAVSILCLINLTCIQF